jgi:hypothetical protein
MKKSITITVLVILLTSVLFAPATSAANKTGSTTDKADSKPANKFKLQLSLAGCIKLAFSTEEDFVTQGPTPPDGNPIISDGDLLGEGCVVCARNHDLVGPFDVSASVDLGLDAADVIEADSSLLVFSTELDSPNVVQFTAGDLLATNGTIIANVALTHLFNLGYDIGLDGVHFVGEKEQIVSFLGQTALLARSYWLQNPGELADMLGRYKIDIWFSTEGTAASATNPAFLDGDLLSAATGTIIARNSDLLPTGVPAGIPTRGVDFGLDAVSSSRIASRQNIRFSTEILYDNDISFTDGDVLEYGTGVVLQTNEDLVNCFEPYARFLGLDALFVALEPVEDDIPHITDIGHIPTGDINGGSVLAGGPGTGLASFSGYDRPFGNWISINGHIPASVYDFRVVYREVSASRPISPATASGIPVVPSTGWYGDRWDGSSCGNIWVPHSSDADGWFNAADYLALTGDSCSSNLALTVWDSTGVTDPDGHYVIWLQWRETLGGTIIEEAFDHHVQLDNTAPENMGLDIPGGACTGFISATMPITPTGQFYDAHFWRYRLRIFGGNPPASHWYPVVNYDSDPDVGPTGTGSSYVDLHEVDVNDLPPASIVDCCYGLRLWVEDRTILGYFYPSVDIMPWGLGLEDSIEITFNYTP